VPITPEIAIRIGKAFGSSPAFWVSLQTNYDLADLEEKMKEIEVKVFFTPPAA